MKTPFSHLLSVIGLLATSYLSAANLITYTFFDSAAPASRSLEIYEPTVVLPEIAASNLSLGWGLRPEGIYEASAIEIATTYSLFIRDGGFNETNETGAITNGDYLSFSLTVESGEAFDLTSLEFFTLRQDDGGSIDEGRFAPTNYSVYSSADGFTTQLGTGAIPADPATNWTLQSVDLSSLQGVTGTTEFRIYLWSVNGIGSDFDNTRLRIDEITLNGDIVITPVTPVSLVEYKFDDNSTIFDPLVAESDLSSGQFSFGAGVGTVPTATSANNAIGSGRSLYFNNSGFYSLIEADAIQQGDYVSFTLDAASGTQVDMDTLSFYIQREVAVGAGAPSNYSVYTSADNFNAQIGTGSIPIQAGFSFHTVDMSAVQNAIGATEVRIILWAADGIATSTERVFRIDELSLTGTLEAGVPELVSYDFDTDTSSPIVNMDFTEANLFATSLDIGPGMNAQGVSGASYSTSAVAVVGSSFLLRNHGLYEVSESSALPGDHLSFLLLVDPGYQIDLGALRFYTLRRGSGNDGSSAPEFYSVYTSADDFASPIGSGSILREADDTTFTLQTVDMSGLAPQVDFVEIRIVFWTTSGAGSFGDGSTRDFRIDELSLTGEVEPAQDPIESLVEYGFVDNTTVHDPLINASNITVSQFQGGSGISTLPNTTSANSVTPRSLFSQSTFTQTTEAGALSNNQYFSFNVTPDSGYQLDLSQLTFYAMRRETSGTSAATNFSVYTSADGFLTQQGTGFIDTVPEASNTFTQFTIDLSSVENVTASTEIRVYFWAADFDLGSTGAERQIRFDDFELTGRVEEAAPAPAGPGTLAQYSFDTNETVFDPVSGTRVTAGPFAPHPTITAMNTTSGSAQSGRSLFSSNSGFFAAIEGTPSTGAISANDYVSFSVTVDQRYQADFERIEFFTLRDYILGAGAPAEYSIYTSVDSFAAPIGNGTIPARGFLNPGENAPPYTFDFESINLSALQDVSGTIEFRIYFWAPQGIATPSAREFRIDELTLTGTVEGIPGVTLEPNFQITPSATPGVWNFTWNSQATGKVYDLVSSDNLATPPSTWPVWNGNSDIASDGEATSLLNIAVGSDPERYFSIIERDAD